MKGGEEDYKFSSFRQLIISNGDYKHNDSIPRRGYISIE